MKKINCIIIDDEEDGRESMRMAIERYCPELFIAGNYATPESGIEAVLQIKPELVFLDVQMPNLSGFDVLQRLAPIGFEVIFVSAYDRYAIKAIRFSALDYLLKPVDAESLVEAVRRVKDKLEKKFNQYPYESLPHNIQSGNKKLERIAVPSLTGIDFFEVNDIVYCSAEGSYTQIHLRSNQHQLISKNLKDFENLLTESGFCRVHHSFLVNLQHVSKYIKGDGGYVIVSTGQQIDISRRKKDEFLSMLTRL